MLTDGRTDERTNGRKLARLCLPAKAGATIMKPFKKYHFTFISLFSSVLFKVIALVKSIFVNSEQCCICWVSMIVLKSRRQNFVCKFAKNLKSKLYYIEHSKTRGQTS